MAHVGKRHSRERTDAGSGTGFDDVDVDDQPTTLPAPAGLAERVRAVLDPAWRPEGYTSPNLDVYPWQWLWDSCFHAIVWARLGEERAVDELANVFAHQDDSGFVPHMTYWGHDVFHAGFWGRRASSSITQPPMFGHAVATIGALGLEVSDETIDRAHLGLVHLLEVRPRRSDGLVSLCHPWESGADDDPRWDHFCPGGFDLGRWRATKGELVGSIERAPSGAPVRNPKFDVASTSFNALLAFNSYELGTWIGDGELLARAAELTEALESRWEPALGTWIDAGDAAGTSGRTRSVGGLLPVLCSTDEAAVRTVFAELLDPAAYGGKCGPAGVHRAEPAFAPTTYWRGPAWPQLTYLFWVAAVQAGRRADARMLAAALVRGARASGMAEYWEPDTGLGLGAAPQSWATLALLVTH